MKSIIAIILPAFLILCGSPEQYSGPSPNNKVIYGIEIHLPSKDLYFNEQMQAEILLIMPSGNKLFDENTNIVWGTGETGVISIDDQGLITANELGEGTITAFMDELRASRKIIVKRKTDYSRILINEIFYDADGADSGKEFIEIYNANDYECDLSGLTIVDGALSSSPFVFPDNCIIGTHSLIIIARSCEDFSVFFGFNPDYSGFSFSLNNSGETVFLLLHDGSINDCVFIEGGYVSCPADEAWGSNEFPSAPEGNSIQRIDYNDTDTYADWESSIPSPGE